ncbi:Heme-binding protein-like protein [Hapsidospora chrysogenum ATCC 11550]|uniref:Heme-binding protein-like protein n=1 Tax=Hapsidospora chrysogenum (strain ATCC 11550 / CBS 779.69 / DSM 880 / IAM 14645 / JCM 23072 / IMI 49137) TaxID=857340 RepID=A0A086TBZ9_HAPC1|nr:Heme-binding protein-like protein [Hapsidospora chrysogenum ATCC 11550]
MANYEASASMSLAESIAAATKSAHAKLNRRILQRLPLALPPRASDPTLYLTGLLHIAPIYITFEVLWQDILNSGTLAEDADAPRMTNGASRDVLAMLQRIHLPDLLRSESLRADVAAMTGWPERVVEQHLATIGRRPGQLAEFLERIRSSVGTKPHVLLSYSYIFFMALFAGGRIIRARLHSAGHGFWDQTVSPITSTTRGEQEREPCVYNMRKQDAFQVIPDRFLRFGTPSDGEDLKREFKKRLSESEAMLTAQQRRDIVQEAVCIFENMTRLMDQLDEVCGETTGLEDIVHEGKASAATMHSGEHPLNTPARTLPQRFGLCPAMSVKSRDLDKIPPLAKRGLPLEKPGGSLRLASRSIQVVSLINWLLLVAILTAIILWALLACRRHLVEW